MYRQFKGMKKLLVCTLLATVLAGMASCKKWLELKPQNGIVADEFWNTKEQVDASVFGIYTSMQGLVESFFIWGEARTDNVLPGFRASQDEFDIVNLNMLSNNRFIRWNGFYQTINYCNTLIELAPGVLQKDETLTEAQLNRALGEALAVRSLMYFYLVRSFRDVPLKLDATLSDQDVANMAKTGSDSILNQIVADLQKAQSFVPLTYGNSVSDKGRITRYAVNAILADVYLWMDKYTECVAECDKIIKSKSFGLVQGGSFFNEVFLEGNSAESIFELQFDQQRTNPFFNIHTPANRRWSAASHLMDNVYGNDLVNATPINDVRGDNAAFRATDFLIWKYIGANDDGTTIKSIDQMTTNWIFYRYADVLLMKAEALNQLDKPLEASRIVKDIRTRARAIDFKNLDSTSKSGMTTFILDERQREFAFEGKRWYDVLRNAKRNNYERLSLLNDMASYSIPPDRRQAAFNKLKDKNSHYFPIHLDEIQTNKLLVQNPFYK